MQKDLNKPTNLLLLQESLINLDEIQIEELGENLYESLFLNRKYSGIHQTHDEQEISFSKDRFRHAFYLSPQKNQIDKRRVGRIRWILPLIQSKVLNSECWLVKDKGVYKRLYICYGLNYVVWLEPKTNNSWVFSTAYVAERKYVQKYQKDGKRIAEFFKK